MSTTVATVIVMQGSKRGEGSKKQNSRLPIIAPKDDVSSSSRANRSANTAITGAPVPSRARLPPRSRTGCWTCRTRKVKCDEGRPVCGQCSRLGHNCDYSPRLSFRDDTQRVVERMQDISTLESTVWDPSSSPSIVEGSTSLAEDNLPPFANLTTDEDRERKAEATTPGTFHVVVNPDSFAHLPEYNDEAGESPTMLSMVRRGSVAHSLASGLGRELTQESVIPTDDPNTVIVSRFEDVSKKPTNTPRDPRQPESPVLPRTQLVMEGDTTTSELAGPSLTTDEISAASRDTDAPLLEHFRKQVWPQLAQFEYGAIEAGRPQYPGEDLIEEIAAQYSPCYHALMALAAACLAHRNGEISLDALTHYQQVLPALKRNMRSAEFLSSDGTFMTHFLLLVYDAAIETGGSSLWSQHLAQLRRMALMRHDSRGGERFGFINWWICNIDLQALFSGAGTGEFVKIMLDHDMMPDPKLQLCPLGTDRLSIIYREERETLPLLLQLNHEITVLACRLGLLAQELRQESLEISFVNEMATASHPVDTRVRQRRILEIQEALRLLWTTPNAVHLKQSLELLPGRSRRVLEHACALYRACLIYSHTSMWATQRLDTGSEYEVEIDECVREILQIAQGIVNQSRFEQRHIIFPLFMAGVASPLGSEKVMALDLMMSMERESIGANTTATKQILRMVYERQTQRFMSVGHSLDVNWMEIMTEQGLQVVSFGL